MISSVAIMTDTDNISETATPYYGDIIFKNKPPTPPFPSTKYLRVSACSLNIIFHIEIDKNEGGTYFSLSGSNLGKKGKSFPLF
jgi:hypothetical protein